MSDHQKGTKERRTEGAVAEENGYQPKATVDHTRSQRSTRDHVHKHMAHADRDRDSLQPGNSLRGSVGALAESVTSQSVPENWRVRESNDRQDLSQSSKSHSHPPVQASSSTYMKTMSSTGAYSEDSLDGPRVFAGLRESQNSLELSASVNTRNTWSSGGGRLDFQPGGTASTRVSQAIESLAQSQTPPPVRWSQSSMSVISEDSLTLSRPTVPATGHPLKSLPSATKSIGNYEDDVPATQVPNALQRVSASGEGKSALTYTASVGHSSEGGTMNIATAEFRDFSTLTNKRLDKESRSSTQPDHQQNEADVEDVRDFSALDSSIELSPIRQHDKRNDNSTLQSHSNNHKSTEHQSLAQPPQASIDRLESDLEVESLEVSLEMDAISPMKQPLPISRAKSFQSNTLEAAHNIDAAAEEKQKLMGEDEDLVLLGTLSKYTVARLPSGSLASTASTISELESIGKQLTKSDPYGDKANVDDKTSGKNLVRSTSSPFDSVLDGNVYFSESDGEMLRWREGRAPVEMLEVAQALEVFVSTVKFHTERITVPQEVR